MIFKYCVLRELEPDLLSGAIMQATNAPYSHAFILVEDIPDFYRIRNKLPLHDSVVFHATIPKYCFNELKKELVGCEIVESVEIQVEHQEFALGWLLGNMGKEYDAAQAFGVIWSQLRDVYRNGEGKGFCSEFAVRFGAVCSTLPYEFNDVDFDFVTPEQGLELYKKVNQLLK